MITVNLDKAKNITHDRRRAKRAEEFAPLDEIIMKQIPGNDTVQAEADRQAIRDKYVLLQTEIDSCESANDLKVIIDRESL